MLAFFVDRVQLQDDRAELWVQPKQEDGRHAVEIGMRWQHGVTHVNLSLSPGEAIVLAHRLIRLAKQAASEMTIATDEQFPDF